MSILSIDIGTSSVKAALLDTVTLGILATAKTGYKIHTANIDWVELSADDVMGAIVDAIKKTIAITGNNMSSAAKIDLICFDNFSPSMLLIDDNGEALVPIITHLDRRSKKQTQDILTKIGKERFQAITGILPFTGGASVTSALWLMENRVDAWKASARLGHINTFVYKQLTGVWAIDPVNASQTGMYETITEGGWSGDICYTLGIPIEKLPEVVNAGKISGGLTKKYAALTGIAEGTPVALGTNDAAAAQIGAGNRVAGSILNITGSSDMVSILTDKPLVNDKYYTRAFCLPSLWQFYVTTAGGFAVDWFREQFCRELSAREFFDVEFEEAARILIDIDIDKELAVMFTPYLAGDRQSLEPKQASFTGLTLDTNRRQMLAALLLAMHEPMKDVLSICESFMKLSGVIKLTGGMMSPAFFNLKSYLFSNYNFEFYDDCPLIGSARLAIENMGNRL